MNLFFQENIDSNIIILSKQESIHITKVLRRKIGDILVLTDGKGFEYRCKIVDISKNCKVEVVEKKIHKKPKEYNLHIAIAPTKSMDRFEWFVEKAVEIGIDRITPLICRYSERKIMKYERIDRIVVSAMKQSLKFHKPVIDKLTDFNKFVQKQTNFQKYIAYCKAKNNFKNIKFSDNILFVVGPEGGFSDFEIDLAAKNSYNFLKISNFRLRTETAGMYISSIVSVIK